MNHQYKLYYVAFSTILRKEITRFMRIWPQTLLPPAITMTLYFVIFGALIGPRIGTLENIPYIQFIAPGLIVMSIITNSYANVTSSFFSLRFQKSIEELLVAPVPEHLILIGFVFGGVVRGFLVGLIVAVIALFFTKLHILHLFIVLSISILTAILFALAGFTNAIFARKFDDIAIIPTFVITPLTYLGGVFYSVGMLDNLPSIWKDISYINPIFYIINTFRHGMLGITDVSVPVSYAMISFFVIIFYILNYMLLKKGVGIRT